MTKQVRPPRAQEVQDLVVGHAAAEELDLVAGGLEQIAGDLPAQLLGLRPAAGDEHLAAVAVGQGQRAADAVGHGAVEAGGQVEAGEADAVVLEELADGLHGGPAELQEQLLGRHAAVGGLVDQLAALGPVAGEDGLGVVLEQRGLGEVEVVEGEAHGGASFGRAAGGDPLVRERGKGVVAAGPCVAGERRGVRTGIAAARCSATAGTCVGAGPASGAVAGACYRGGSAAKLAARHAPRPGRQARHEPRHRQRAAAGRGCCWRRWPGRSRGCSRRAGGSRSSPAARSGRARRSSDWQSGRRTWRSSRPSRRRASRCSCGRGPRRSRRTA